jgi:hypothetical protein
MSEYDKEYIYLLSFAFYINWLNVRYNFSLLLIYNDIFGNNFSRFINFIIFFPRYCD